MFRDDRSRNLAMFVERNVLPLAFLYFGASNLWHLVSSIGAYTHLLESDAFTSASGFLYLSQDLRFVGLSVFNLVVAYALWISRDTHVKPEGAKEVLVPLVATFWYIVVNLTDYLPQQLNIHLVPSGWMNYVKIVGGILALAGMVLSLAGVLNMRRSFGIMVRVNDIVVDGLYRFMRHPIYFAYLLSFTGLVLLRPTLYEAVVYGLAAAITLYRARLEEQKLAAHSATYRAYMETVPFMPWSSK